MPNDENTLNVIELTVNAVTEIRRRMAAGGFDDSVAVRVVSHRAGTDCVIQFDYLCSDGRDWIGRSHGLVLLIEKAIASSFQHAIVDFQSGEFRVRHGIGV